YDKLPASQVSNLTTTQIQVTNINTSKRAEAEILAPNSSNDDSNFEDDENLDPITVPKKVFM
ncbi:MAG: hypothetical protein MHPSP_001311, partial [Paramarteilia canceri]